MVFAEIKGGWWRFSAWKKDWAGGLKRACISLVPVWTIVILWCLASEMQQEAHVVNDRTEVKKAPDARSESIPQPITAAPAKPRRAARREVTAATIIAKLRTTANDILDYQENAQSSAPPLILSAIPGQQDLTARSLEAVRAHDAHEVIEFLKKFGGPLDEIVQKLRPYGVNTSRLQGHVRDINNVVMMRLIANDLNALGDELEERQTKGAPQIAGRVQIPGGY